MDTNNILNQLKRYSEWYLSSYTTNRHSFKQILERWLTRKGYEIDDSSSSFIEKLIVENVHSGIINDSEYIWFRVKKWRERGWSDRIISLKLAKVGFCSELIKKSLLDNDEKTSSRLAKNRVIEILVKKNLSYLEDTSIEEKEKRRKKALGIISRRGFSKDVAEEILSKIGY